MKAKITVLGPIALAAALMLSGCRYAHSRAQDETVMVRVFRDNMIHFAPETANSYATAHVRSLDNGRVIVRDVTLPSWSEPVRITAHLTLKPIPKDEISVHDSWDRAGNVRLCRPGMADIEVVKFVTAYGGRTEHTVDVTHLAPVLKGAGTFKAFIDTWVTPAWRVDFRLEFTRRAPRRRWDCAPRPGSTPPDWAKGLLYAETVTAANQPEDGVRATVTIPPGMKRVMMHFYSTGHCTDGRGADEFVAKDNVILIDGREVYRFQPWRDDCRQFRAINPYCRRWSDGSWSADYDRSGWCPGDVVTPTGIDLTRYLTPGPHVVHVLVEEIRPADEEDHHGYWRLSSYLLGWLR